MSDHATAVGNAFPWHEVYGPSADSIVAFYTGALDMGTEAMDMGEMGTYHMLTHNGVAVCGAVGTAGNPDMADVKPHWATYLAVDDVDARVEKIKSMGGACYVPPMDVPTVGRMALCADPNGATFWIYKSANG